MNKRTWSIKQLKKAAKNSTSIRQVIHKLGLVGAGGNYVQIKKYLFLYKISMSHFRGKAWNKGLKGISKKPIPLEKILIENSGYQTFKLKNRLLRENILQPKCVECGWAKRSEDGRLPLELDHINGNSKDNRLENLRILCPNCHSLKLTHRGKNKKARVAELVYA